MFWIVLKVYHPVLSSFLPMVNPILSVPRIVNFLSLMMYVFAVVLSSLIHLIYIVADQSAYINDLNTVLAYAGIYLGCAFIFRPLFNYLKQGMYLQYATIKETVNTTGKRSKDSSPGQSIMRNPDYLTRGHGPTEAEFHGISD